MRFFRAASAAKGCSPGVLDLGWRKLRAGFARIGIDAENQEFGRQGPQIDLAVDDRLRRLVAAKLAFAATDRWRIAASGHELQVDRFADLAFDRFEGDHASLPDPRFDLPQYPNARALAGQIEGRRELRQAPQRSRAPPPRRGLQPALRFRYAGPCRGYPPPPPARSRGLLFFPLEQTLTLRS